MYSPALGNVVQYATFTLSHSPTRENRKRSSALEFLSGIASDLREFVVFSSLCSVYRDTSKKNALQQREQIATIVGISEETKEYKIHLHKAKKVIVPQYVKNIDTLSEA